MSVVYTIDKLLYTCIDKYNIIIYIYYSAVLLNCIMEKYEGLVEGCRSSVG